MFIICYEGMNAMGEKKDFSQDQAIELLNWGIEIDELQSMAKEVKSESAVELPIDKAVLRTKIETARERLIQIFILLKSQNSAEGG
jgi:hypothetical protein